MGRETSEVLSSWKPPAVSHRANHAPSYKARAYPWTAMARLLPNPSWERKCTRGLAGECRGSLESGRWEGTMNSFQILCLPEGPLPDPLTVTRRAKPSGKRTAVWGVIEEPLDSALISATLLTHIPGQDYPYIISWGSETFPSVSLARRHFLSLQHPASSLKTRLILTLLETQFSHL